MEEAEREEAPASSIVATGGAITVADWSLECLTAYKCRREEGLGDGPGRMLSVPLGAMTMFGPQDTLLEEFLDEILLAAFRKKPDIGDASPCRIFGFRQGNQGMADQQLLDKLLRSRMEDFEPETARMAKRYTGLAHSRDGVFLFARVTIRAKSVPDLPFLCIFKCDYEDARAFDENMTVRILDEVIIRKLKKVMIYPHFDEIQQDFSRVKLYQSNASDYFEEFLWLEKPAVARELLQRELRNAIALRHDDKFDNHFTQPAPKKRELFGEQRYIPLNDLLRYEEVKFVNDEVCVNSREKFDKPVRAQIKIDETVKVDATMDGLGKSFFFAKRGDFRYLIIRGESFTTSGPLSSLDFLEVQDLDEVLPNLDDDGAGGGEGGDDRAERDGGDGDDE